jgi:hypothetical protein
MALDKERIKQKIAILNKKIDGEADPRLLNEYRILFKKEVSLFRRSWTAAYLLMLYDQGTGAGNFRKESGSRPKAKGSRGGEGEKSSRRTEGSENRDSGENGGRADAPRPFLAEDESRRLFISIGRNRRVFPREILGLIITRAQVVREDIGMIRILDNYSFVQVRDTVADTIIEALNGTVFRGRTITANYARLKGEDPGEAGAAAADTDPEDAGPVIDRIEPEDPYPEGPSEAASVPDDYPQDLEEDGGYNNGSEHDDDLGDEEGV